MWCERQSKFVDRCETTQHAMHAMRLLQVAPTRFSALALLNSLNPTDFASTIPLQTLRRDHGGVHIVLSKPRSSRGRMWCGDD